METLNNIIWLASYPKAGNTWFRSFLTAIKSDKPSFDINDLETDGIFSNKYNLEEVLDVDSDFLYIHEIQKYQRLVWNHISSRAKSKLFIKIHDAFDFLPHCENKSLIPEEATYKAIYFVRNPFDVVPSLANHFGGTISNTLKFLNSSDSFLGNKIDKKRKGEEQFCQHLGTWNEHVKSWLTHPNFPVMFIRYEDMKMNTFETFKNAIEYLELNYSDSQIQQALSITSFENLRKQEEATTFKERPPKAKFFFNKGEMNYGKSLLTEEQIESLKTVNEEMMRHFGYWH